ncbi:MAG: HTH domain-containing protein [Candidatus Paceibacterota bacterium]
MEIFQLLLVGALGIIFGIALTRPGSHEKLKAFVNTERYPLKEHRKEMLVKHLKDRKTLTNGEAQELLGVSDRTVVRYFDELEAEGVVVQEGDVGRSVYYTLT